MHSENESEKSTHCSGHAYFVTVKKIFENFHMEISKLFLQLKADSDVYNFDPGHNSSKSEYLLVEISCQIFARLPDLETRIFKYIKMSLLYILIYLIKNSLTE